MAVGGPASSCLSAPSSLARAYLTSTLPLFLGKMTQILYKAANVPTMVDRFVYLLIPRTREYLTSQAEENQG